MFCAKCGTQIPDDAGFCTSCGNPVAAQPVQETAYQQPVYQQPEQPLQPALPMKWFKFLIYFALWAGALLNIVLNGVVMLNGLHYGDAETAKLVYAMFEDLKGLDTLCGVLAIVMGVFSIYTRFQLAGFKKKGPMLLAFVYAGAIVFNLIYIIGCNSILPEYVLSEMDYTSFYSNTVTSAVMIFVNMAYFKKRAHLFVN